MSLKMIFEKKSIGPFFWTQFFGALNDNFMKNALVLIVAYKGVQIFGMASNQLVSFASGIFILPFFLFSPIAGQLADKFEKSLLIRYTKLIELAIMIFAGFGFYFNSFKLLMLVLFLMGTQSAFFGPLKYSIIPQLLPEEKLTSGTAYVELGTFVAILVGLILGGWVTSTESGASLVGIGLVGVSFIGYIFSRNIKQVEIGQKNLKLEWNPIPSMGKMWKIINSQKAVVNSVLAISWFWFFGAGILTILPVFCKETLSASQDVVTLFMALFTIGIAAGSLLSEKLSFGRVEIGLVPIGSIGMTLFLGDIYWTSLSIPDPTDKMGIGVIELLVQPHGLRIAIDLFILSIFGGIFIVPLYTLIQQRSDDKVRSQVIAGNNVLNALFMVVASLMIIGLYGLGLSHPEVFLVFALLNAAAAIYIHLVVPEFTLRFLAWIFSHLFYRLKVTGEENIPKEGAVILSCNHVSYIDWLIIFGACKRPARFVMYYKFFQKPLLRTLFKQGKVIPIASAHENKSILTKAYHTIESDLINGEVICIFPEGEITRNGEINQFRPGLSKIVEKTEVSVIPIALCGLWGSIFSRSKDKHLFRSPFKFWRKIEVHIGVPIPAKELNLTKLQELTQSMRSQK